MAKRRSIRKPNHREHGMQVTICGKRLGNSDSICLLPTHHEGSTHATLAIGDISITTDDNDDDTRAAVLAALFDPNTDEEVLMWQLRELAPPIRQE